MKQRRGSGELSITRLPEVRLALLQTQVLAAFGRLAIQECIVGQFVVGVAVSVRPQGSRSFGAGS